MSGDVQPRKRKDKRKKRDDRKSEGDISFSRQPSFQDDEDSSSHGVHITKMGNDDVHLHVQHSHGTGGHWCAKIIFFSLMAVLLGLVGLIIMENRGIEDLDTPLSQSRYSNYFDGWVEEHRQEDEHGAHGSPEAALDDHDVDEHDDEHEEEYELHSVEEDAEEEHDDEEEADAEDEDDEEEEKQDTAAENVTAEEEEEEDEEQDEDDEDVAQSVEPAQSTLDEEEENDEELEESIEPVISKYQAQSAPETAEDDEDVEDEEDDEADEEDNEAISQSQPQTTAEEQDEEEDEDEEEFDDGDDDEVEEEPEESVEPPAASQADEVEQDDEDDLEQEDNDEDDFESLDQDIDEEPTVKAPPTAAKPEKEQQEQQAETTTSWLGSLAVKFGVGIALALVSRLVLIRKNPNTTDEEPTQEANMRRRLTIATAEDNIPDDLEELPPLDDEEYSEEEIEIEEEIEVEISDAEQSDDNIAINASYVPETFEQLSAMYRSKTEAKPESKPEPQPTPKTEPKPEQRAEPTVKTRADPKSESETDPEVEQTTHSDIYVEYDDGDIEDYENIDTEEEDDDELSDEEEDEISDVDDAELMSRLEAKYGRLPAKEYESDPDSDDPSWTQIKAKKEPTGAEDVDADDLFEQELRKANAEMINEHDEALRAFNQLTHTYAHKPAAHLGRAQTLLLMAAGQRSNRLLLDAIESLKRYLAFGNLIRNDTEFRVAGEECINQLRFLGYLPQAVAIHELLIARFPQDVFFRNQLSLTHLMANNLVQLQLVATETLKLFPRDAVAQLHLGLALKQLHSDYARALPYLQFAVDSQLAGTQEPYFYLALGETLQRLGRHRQALELHQRGAHLNFFASAYQRSLYNEPKLRAKPFWMPSDTGYGEQLEELQHSWRAIRREGLLLLNKQGNFKPEAEQLRDTGKWQQFELYTQGKRMEENCKRAPITCALLERLPAATSCRRGQIKFSAMQSGTHVWPHCGPTNCRLRAHLTLVAPEPHLTSLRVADEHRTWYPGNLFIFDDSFEHEVWHNGTQLRLVLIVDLWHPDLSAQQRRSLTPI